MLITNGGLTSLEYRGSYAYSYSGTPEENWMNILEQ